MRLALVGLVGVVACSAPATEPEDAGGGVDPCAVDGGVCPPARETTCRIERLLADATACASSDDCTLFIFPPNCLDYGRCPGVAVSYASEARFSIDASRLLTTFCNTTTCRPQPPCTERRAPAAACLDGRCRLSFPDAGIDAGTRDGGR
ncbi:MAG: hypothetical protein JNJ54_35365 [Myxococcaceae bacterium]|nr:hypothetical protein [Myxococcaceae bacterium]